MRQQDAEGLAYLQGDGDETEGETERGTHDGHASFDSRASGTPDEGGAHNAFVAGLLYALTKRVRMCTPELGNELIVAIVDSARRSFHTAGGPRRMACSRRAMAHGRVSQVSCS